MLRHDELENQEAESSATGGEVQNLVYRTRKADALPNTRCFHFRSAIISQMGMADLDNPHSNYNTF
jgi:hypothetical protein